MPNNIRLSVKLKDENLSLTMQALELAIEYADKHFHKGGQLERKSAELKQLRKELNTEIENQLSNPQKKGEL